MRCFMNEEEQWEWKLSVVTFWSNEWMEECKGMNEWKSEKEWMNGRMKRNELMEEWKWSNEWKNEKEWKNGRMERNRRCSKWLFLPQRVRTVPQARLQRNYCYWFTNANTQIQTKNLMSWAHRIKACKRTGSNKEKVSRSKPHRNYHQLGLQ